MKGRRITMHFEATRGSIPPRNPNTWREMTLPGPSICGERRWGAWSEVTTERVGRLQDLATSAASQLVCQSNVEAMRYRISTTSTVS